MSHKRRLDGFDGVLFHANAAWSICQRNFLALLLGFAQLTSLLTSVRRNRDARQSGGSIHALFSATAWSISRLAVRAISRPASWLVADLAANVCAFISSESTRKFLRDAIDRIDDQLRPTGACPPAMSRA